MRWTIGLAILLACACHGAKSTAADVSFDTPVHMKSGSTCRVADVTFTVQILPTEMVSGPVPEIEQAQISVARGADHHVLQIDTVNKRAAWGGVAFELGYADAIHDDLMFTVRRVR